MRFRLRTLLIAVLLIALALGWLASRIDDARTQRNAVAALSRIGAHVSYNSSYSFGRDSRFDKSTQQSMLTRKLDEWLGLRLFGCVVAVHAERLDRRGMDGLARIGDLPQIQLINLDRSPVTDRDLVHLRSLHRLRTLYLWGTEVGDAGIEDIADLKELRRLGLQRTLITDAGVERLRDLKNLDTLSLAETRVTDKCVPDLATLKKLTHLDLSYTQVSERGIARLRSELPRAQIIHRR